MVSANHCQSGSSIITFRIAYSNEWRKDIVEIEKMISLYISSYRLQDLLDSPDWDKIHNKMVDYLLSMQYDKNYVDDDGRPITPTTVLEDRGVTGEALTDEEQLRLAIPEALSEQRVDKLFEGGLLEMFSEKEDEEKE